MRNGERSRLQGTPCLSSGDGRRDPPVKRKKHVSG
ncbi:MAG: hypothetical protein QOJ64_1491 [Acidobacteriota bacterium]|nr:hypothetical protein [Acidobacteriota bacterium]